MKAKENQALDVQRLNEKLGELLTDLTDKQYKFLLAVIEGKGDVEAYRQVYKADKMRDPACSIEAFRLRTSPKMSAIIEALRLEGVWQAIDNRQAHLQRLRQLAARAEKTGNYGAAVNAEVNAGKVEGHYIERRENVTPDKPLQEFEERWGRLAKEEPEGDTVH